MKVLQNILLHRTIAHQVRIKNIFNNVSHSINTLGVPLKSYVTLKEAVESHSISNYEASFQKLRLMAERDSGKWLRLHFYF